MPLLTRSGRIELALGAAGDAHVFASGTERRAGGERLGFLDLEGCDARVGGGCDADHQRCDGRAGDKAIHPVSSDILPCR